MQAMVLAYIRHPLLVVTAGMFLMGLLRLADMEKIRLTAALVEYPP